MLDVKIPPWVKLGEKSGDLAINPSALTRLELALKTDLAAYRTTRTRRAMLTYPQSTSEYTPDHASSGLPDKGISESRMKPFSFAS
jgi:hypothetical protein